MRQRPTLANRGEPRQPRTPEQLAADLDATTWAIFKRLEADGALGVVVIVAHADAAVVGCAGENTLAHVWPEILRTVSRSIGRQAEAALERRKGAS